MNPRLVRRRFFGRSVLAEALDKAARITGQVPESAVYAEGFGEGLHRVFSSYSHRRLELARRLERCIP